MDARTFDRWTAALAHRPTRRITLGLLAGGLLGGLLSSRKTARAQPECTDCGGVCVDLSSDPYNCGGCGIVCAAGEACGGGVCTAGTGTTGGIAADGGYLIADVQEPTGALLSCAALGLVDCAGLCCATDEFCIEGVCLGVVAQAGTGTGALFNECVAQGLADCGGVCVDLASHAGHCGACFTSCPLGGYCQGGICTLACASALTNCGGRCVDLNTDWSHCGGCEFGCFEGTDCVNGACI